ncbi:MAG: Gfo/Idh/MocA family oxidoreductase [Kiritimatiellae bacterium]|nr:Gfo/Idh/MocA family oxidoreductase [Kiritimatiellia bacterium]
MNRRSFLATAGAAALAPSVMGQNKAARIFKVALVGCGGRGTGAMRDIHAAAKRLGCEIKITALADFFADKVNKLGDAYGVDPKVRFVGADGYLKAIATDCEIVMLCTPPFFRPLHLEACVAAGKHIFAEKPIATDPRGVRRFLKAAAEAKAKKLSLLAGTCVRHRIDVASQLNPFRAGALGQVRAGRVYRCHGSLRQYERPRRPTDTNAGYLANCWYMFWEMGGDQITEQAIHQVDTANWFIGRCPESALAFGGRWRRPMGDIYDELAIDFDYGDELHVAAYGRHVDGCANPVGTRLVCTDGYISIGGKMKRFDGKDVAPDMASVADFEPSNLVQEHKTNLQALLEGRFLAEGEQLAMATATCVMGTLAAYSGRVVKMRDILENERSEFYDKWNTAFLPEDFERTDDIPLPPDGKAGFVPGVAQA